MTLPQEWHPPVEEYLETVLQLEEEGVTVIQARLADRVGHSPATVSEMIKRLSTDGYVVVDGRAVTLTPAGRARAESVVRKHRLAERLLADVIGLEWEKIHDEAGRWEHVISDDVEAKLVALLGNPATCPHGNPIPGGAPLPDVERVRLADIDTGGDVVLDRVSEEVELDRDALQYLAAHHFTPGARGRVTARAPDGALTIDVQGHPLALGHQLAARLLVTRG